VLISIDDNVNVTHRKEQTMREMRYIFTCITLTVALALPTAGKAADHKDSGDDSPTITVETTHDEGVGWFFPLNHAQCGAISEDLGDINPINRARTDPLGDRVSQTTTTVEADGSRQIDRIDLVTGMAQDSHGKRYIWAYENHRVFDVPPGEGPVHVSIIIFDRFRLIGNGLNTGVSFSSRWEFQVPSGSAFDPGQGFTGVIFPDDLLNPTNVLNFKNFGTQGDGACDPL